MTVVSSTESCERFSVVTMFEMDNVETASFWLQTVIYSYFGLGKKEIKEMQTVLLRKKISPSLSFKMVQTICDSIVLKRNDAYNSNCLYKQQLNIYDFSPFAVSCGIVLVIILAIYIYNKRLRDREVYRLQLIGGREY
ncbi:hypothetical protein MHBO_005179 [Bonamia ostreae]|uniref:Uncharacterized protein n=1 Tax=Bonamia ostreae TaxID=126728 RepID=A0ABV2AV88_9EUKA